MEKTIQTLLSNDLVTAEEDISIDNQIKIVLANKSILSRILPQYIKEFFRNGL